VLRQEIVAMGCGGHYERVRMAIAPLRRGLPIDVPRERSPAPRQVARWVITAPSGRGLYATVSLRRLFEHGPHLAATRDLVRQFSAMLDAREATPLADWLDHTTSQPLGFRPCRPGQVLREDQQAAVRGITTPFNSVVNVGRITDLKLRKGIAAGGAGVPLLRRRVILMAHLRRRYP
jgi:transposase